MDGCKKKTSIILTSLIYAESLIPAQRAHGDPDAADVAAEVTNAPCHFLPLGPWTNIYIFN